MLLHAIQPTLCQLGLHVWQPDPRRGNVAYCARCGATKVTLKRGSSISVHGLEITVPHSESNETEKRSTAR
jgi:hypothetical protein